MTIGLQGAVQARRWSRSMTTMVTAPSSGFSLWGYGACRLVVGSAGSMIGARNASNLRVRMHRK